nr:short-chain dehydrogenase tic 32, chloroplastic [Quercus suber]
MWIFSRKGPSGFSASSTAEEVTKGIDGTGLTAIVTGASSGLGAETTRVLTLRGVHVIMAVRNTDAGVMATPFKLSQDNIELQFATNHIGHFLLTNHLLETMKKTAGDSNKEGRIVNLSSMAHQYAYREGIRFDKINDESGYNSINAYGQSKLANILHANELAKRLKEEGVDITANSLHPRMIATNLLRYHSIMNVLTHALGKFMLESVQQGCIMGAATQCYVALHPQVKGISGEYFADSNKAKASALSQDAELARKLWDFSFSMTNQN